MKRLLLGVVCGAVILGGCADNSDGEQANTDQTEEIADLKEQVEQLSLEKDALSQTVEEQKKALESAEVAPQTEPPNDVNNDSALIKASEIDKYPQTLYKEMTLDIDGDGKEEIIELYVNAGIMDNGQFAWDDGQNWLLVVKDGDKTYPLFDEYIQLGSLDFSTATFDKKPGIVMYKREHADRTVQKFVFDTNKEAFEKETFYKKENTQDQYNQAASFAFFDDANKFMNTAFTTRTKAALEAGEDVLQDSQKRRTIIEPILIDVENAQGLLDIVKELNPNLTVTLDNAADLLYQMVSNKPTAEQMDQLNSIHNVFKEIGNDDWINKEENQIHPEMIEKLREIGLYS